MVCEIINREYYIILVAVNKLCTLHCFCKSSIDKITLGICGRNIDSILCYIIRSLFLSTFCRVGKLYVRRSTAISIRFCDSSCKSIYYILRIIYPVSNINTIFFRGLGNPKMIIHVECIVLCFKILDTRHSAEIPCYTRSMDIRYMSSDERSCRIVYLFTTYRYVSIKVSISFTCIPSCLLCCAECTKITRCSNVCKRCQRSCNTFYTFIERCSIIFYSTTLCSTPSL